MGTVSRFDAGKLTKAERTPQGYLRAPAHATRAGVFVYRKRDGSILRELRHPDEVFNTDSMRSLANIPLTNNHPKDGMLNAVNTRIHLIGYTGESVAREDSYLKIGVTITDEDAIKQAESGKHELSCGYTCELDDSPGEFEGEKYDCIQRNIIYNHLAIVDKGRAGPNARLRLDDDDAVQDGVQIEIEKKGASTVEKVKLDGKDFEVSPEVAAAIKAETRSAGDAAARDARADADRARAKADDLQAKLDKANEELKTRQDAADPARVRELVKARSALNKVAEKTLPKEQAAKLDELDDKALKVAVIKAEHPQVNLDGKSDEYINARFDLIAEGMASRSGDDSNLGSNVHNLRKDNSDAPNAEAARKAAMERDSNLWKSAGNK